MKQQLYAIKDVQLNSFGPPIALPNKNIAVRVFTENVNNKDPRYKEAPIVKYPQDHDLYMIAEYCTETGTTTSQTPVKICNLASLKQAETSSPQHPAGPEIPPGKIQHIPQNRATRRKKV